MNYRGVGLTASVVLAGLLVGCSGASSAPSEGEPALPASLPKVDMATFRLPLSAYETTEEQDRTAYTARNILLVRCLQRFGFTVTPPGPSEPTPGGPNERRYLLASEERAHIYGYKWPEITSQKRPAEPDLSPEADSAITGKGASQIGGVQVPDGGCMGEAKRQLGIQQSTESGLELLRRLSNDAYLSMQKDSRVVAATVRWSECMQRSGYHYPDPARANNDPTFASDIASPAEIATAVADVKCKKEVNLIDIMAAVETAYQQRSMDQHQQQLKDLKDQVDAQSQTAADVVAGRK